MNDLISREEARDLMYHNQEPLTEYDLDSLPSIKAESVKHGHWIYNKENGEVKCSRCRAEVAVTMCATDLEEILADENYCFKCGAKMDEEEGQNMITKLWGALMLKLSRLIVRIGTTKDAIHQVKLLDKEINQ